MKEHKEIGGYFELELRRGSQLHANLFAVNSARAGLRLLLRELAPSKVFVPVYNCNAVTEAIKAEGVNFDVYQLNKKFEPILPVGIDENCVVIINNYFGLCDDVISNLIGRYSLIVDNAQSFFSKPLQVIGSIYSPRKFVGVGDGGFLASLRPIVLPEHTSQSTTATYCHLLLRHNVGAHNGYNYFKESEDYISKQEPARMSILTNRILESIDYNNVAARRVHNYQHLHGLLGDFNLFPEIWNGKQVPLCYPFIPCGSSEELRVKLLNNKIYCPIYWPEVFNANAFLLNKFFLQGIVPLPIDQRYTNAEMELIAKVVLS